MVAQTHVRLVALQLVALAALAAGDGHGSTWVAGDGNCSAPPPSDPTWTGASSSSGSGPGLRTQLGGVLTQRASARQPPPPTRRASPTCTRTSTTRCSRRWSSSSSAPPSATSSCGRTRRWPCRVAAQGRHREHPAATRRARFVNARPHSREIRRRIRMLCKSSRLAKAKRRTGSSSRRLVSIAEPLRAPPTVRGGGGRTAEARSRRPGRRRRRARSDARAHALEPRRVARWDLRRTRARSAAASWSAILEHSCRWRRPPGDGRRSRRRRHTAGGGGLEGGRTAAVKPGGRPLGVGRRVGARRSPSARCRSR